MKIAFVIPPLVDSNGPYASAPRLTAWLRSLGHEVDIVDLSLEVLLRVFCREGLERMFDAVDTSKLTPRVEDVLLNKQQYIDTIDSAVAFVQNRDVSPAHRIANGNLLPNGPFLRDHPVDKRRVAYGKWGIMAQSRFVVGGMMTDLVELFRETIAPHFLLNAYGEKLIEDGATLDEILAVLDQPNELESVMMDAAADSIAEDVDMVCVSSPFTGTVLGALILGRWLGEHRPNVPRVLGGAMPTTALRNMTDPRIFEFYDYVVIDDGEVPLRQLCARLEGKDAALHNTFVREDDKVVWNGPATSGEGCAPVGFRDVPFPDYTGMQLDRYLHLTLGLAHSSRLLSEGLWLRITAAHGCYWKKCTFCDIDLPLVGDFEPRRAAEVADEMDALHEQTGLSSFIFNDEAMPPSLLVRLALELLRRERTYQYWGNIRWEKAFTVDRCRLLAASGLVAVCGGVEIASEPVLELMEKGTTLEQIIQAMQAMSGAGVINHGYLLHGFPGETAQDTIDSLEVVRQLICTGSLHSAGVCALVVRSYSPLATEPEKFGLKILEEETPRFAQHIVPFENTKPPGDKLMAKDLHWAINSYERGEGRTRDVRTWFRADVPAPTVASDLVAGIKDKQTATKGERLCWLGGLPQWRRGILTVTGFGGKTFTASAPESVADALRACHPTAWPDGVVPAVTDWQDEHWRQRLAPWGLVVV